MKIRLKKLHFANGYMLTAATLKCYKNLQQTLLICLFEKLTKLIHRDLIAKQQSSFISKVEENLRDGDSLLTCDFAENYTFVIQDDAHTIGQVVILAHIIGQVVILLLPLCGLP